MRFYIICLTSLLMASCTNHAKELSIFLDDENDQLFIYDGEKYYTGPVLLQEPINILRDKGYKPVVYASNCLDFSHLIVAIELSEVTDCDDIVVRISSYDDHSYNFNVDCLLSRKGMKSICSEEMVGKTIVTYSTTKEGKLTSFTVDPQTRSPLVFKLVGSSNS